MSDHSATHGGEQKDESITTYTVVFVLLLVLLVATYLAYLMDIGPIANLVIALIIAVTKASMVLFIFMHVRMNPKLVWVFALASFLWLILMISGFLQDYGSRPMDGEWAHHVITSEGAAMQDIPQQPQIQHGS